MRVKRKRDYKGEKDRNQNRKRKAEEGGVKRDRENERGRLLSVYRRVVLFRI